MAVLITITTLLSVAAGVGYLIYWFYRKALREAKNYERGLKMVPLLIHLPPTSEDINAQGRDDRDIIEESASKAEILYNILASITTKGFSSKFYGQRHISLEIMAAKGIIRFYTAVPINLVSVVEQAITSAYPSARLEEVAEHNIFSPVGKLSGTYGGELILKEHYAYPIATFQESKRDGMQAILNALVALKNTDGAGIQILLRPAYPSWTKNALAVAIKKRKDKGKRSAGSHLSSKGMAGLLWKPPEIEEVKPEDKQLSTLEQSIVDAIEDKTRHPAYEISIRLVASSNIASRSQVLLRNIVAAFALFDSPGKNGFRFVEARDMQSFVTSFIFRFFPPESNRVILNSVELASIFHLPDQKHTPTSQVERQMSKQVDGPNNLPTTGLLLGYNEFRGVKKEVRLTDKDRARHMYIIGQTGTGKSTFMENLAVQDMLDGKGFAYIDPHGDTAEKLICMVPKERTEDIIYFCPADMDYPIGLNLFGYDSPEQKDFLIQESLNMLYKLYDPQRQGIVGPRFERIFTNAALLLMSGPVTGTFVDVPKLLVDNEYMKSRLKYVTDANVLDFWTKEWPASQRSNDAGEVTAWVVSKFGAFQSNEMMRNIIGQEKSSLKLREIMDEGKILLVNLSKGRTGELNAKLLGMIFVMQFYAAAMGRANMLESERRDFTLYVDEFQNFSTDSFASILSEARKFKLSLVVANQYIGQLTDEIRDAVFGNVGSVMSFRTGAADADFLVKFFSPIFETDDLVKMPNFNLAAQMLIEDMPTQPFTVATLPPLGTPNKKLGDALKNLSNAKYARPRAIVGKEIADRLHTQSKSQGYMSPGSPTSRLPQRPGVKPGGGSSFLDDWLAKRGTKPVSVSSDRNALADSITPPKSAGQMPVTSSSPFSQADIRQQTPLNGVGGQMQAHRTQGGIATGIDNTLSMTDTNSSTNNGNILPSSDDTTKPSVGANSSDNLFGNNNEDTLRIR